MAETTSKEIPATSSHRRMPLLFSGLLAAMFMSTIDQTVVGTAMRTIADDLGGQSQQVCPSVAFLITSTIATPLWMILTGTTVFGISVGLLIRLSL